MITAVLPSPTSKVWDLQQRVDLFHPLSLIPSHGASQSTGAKRMSQMFNSAFQRETEPED